MDIKAAILDSGPLLIALSLNYAVQQEIEKSEFVGKAYSKSKDKIYIDKAEKLFSNLQTFYSTPHVVGEVIGLVRSKLKLKNEEAIFWAKSIEYLSKKNFNEQFIGLLELSKDSKISDLIPQIGFVDSELIKLAIKMTDKKIPILSIDRRTLANKAQHKNVNVLIMDDVIHQFESTKRKF